MPDKEIMLQIRAREEARPWLVADALISADVDRDNAPAALREALTVLAADWHETASLYERAKGKGFKTIHVDPLRHAAQQLDEVIKGLDQPRRAPLGQIQPVSAPPATDGEVNPATSDFPPAECPNVAAKHAHPAHGWIGGPQGLQDPLHARGWRWCSGHIGGPTERSGLDALIAEAQARHNDLADITVTVPEQRGPAEGEALGVTDAQRGDTSKLIGDVFDSMVLKPSAPITGDDVAAFLSGAVAELPGPPPPPSTVRNTDPTTGEAIEPPADPFAEIEPAPITTARENIATMDPAIAAAIPPVPLLGQPGDAGAGYGVSYVPPGGVPATFAELLQPVPAAALPPHLSHSQIDTVGQCGVKYRLTRVGRPEDRDGGADWPETLHEVPEWSHIGGNTFHAIVEMLEQRWAQNPAAAPPRDDENEMLWSTYFEVEIGKIEASSPVPRARWRASKQGAEGETWWRANGPLMIARYLAARPAEPTALLPDPAAGAALAIEIERTVQVPTGYGPIAYKAILDRVTLRYDPATGVTTYVIRDYKTGASMPSDPQQLGEYANVLRLLGVPPTARIVGTFFNARKGTWTPEVDLDAAYPAEWFQYYITTGYAQRLALTAGPTPARPSSFCGGCTVRWACPVKGVNAPGGAGGAR